MVQRRHGSTSLEPGKSVAQRILEHPYVLNDAAGSAKEAARHARYQRCKKMLAGLIERLKRGEIQQLGLEGTTGQSTLTVERLTDRPVKLLDLHPDWLLLALERHPFGNDKHVLVHHWLYSKRAATVELVDVDEIERVEPGTVQIQAGDGTWHPPSEQAERDFYSTVAALLGDDAVRALQRLAARAETWLCAHSDDLIARCEAISGIPYRTEEAARIAASEAQYRSKYGESQLPPGIGLVPGIRLGFARPQRRQRPVT